MRGPKAIAAMLMLAASLTPAWSFQAAPVPAPIAPPAVPPELVALMRQNLYAIALENGRLTGPGADFLRREFADVQFVGLGETHNNADIPPLTTALFRELHDRHGFNYFATEQDPVTMRAFSAAPLRGNADAIGEATRREPYSVTFATDQELEMLAEIGRTANGRHRPIWGCEQAFGATHILRRLEARAPNAAAREVVRSLRERAAAVEARRDPAISQHFMARTELAEDMARLRAAFPNPDAETAFMLRAVTLSPEIYSYYRAAVRGEMPGGWTNSRVREEYMKEVCGAEYRAALAADRAPPRVLFKFGHWHVYEVNSPASITTLGTFFSQAARMNGMGYRSIGVMPTRYEGRAIWEGDDNPEMLPFAPIADHGRWQILDLRPLREYPRFRQLVAAMGDRPPTARNALTRVIYGFDFLFMIGDHRDGTYRRAAIAEAPPAAR